MEKKSRRTLYPSKNRPELGRLLNEATAAFEALPPEQQELVLREQQKSFTRQDMD
jgi:hypothetical protein